jgi:hypothetical protein
MDSQSFNMNFKSLSLPTIRIWLELNGLSNITEFYTDKSMPNMMKIIFFTEESIIV